ncbi:MAG TPA: 2-phospho-L-lactate guanylyltransferase [Pseudolysinimonas sp.]|nr:2-phospho-L-lactate guanylyltransferase [Pseudolysinimonas sp.]
MPPYSARNRPDAQDELASSADRWHVIVPVKDPAEGKRRLLLAGRVDLARAFALDTLAAAAMAPSVAVVHIAASPGFAIEALAASADWPIHAPLRPVSDVPPGLNPAILHALASVIESHPGSPVAVLLGDLPALRSDELDAALSAAAAHSLAFVRDADGHGTTLLTALDAQELRPAFGPGSAAAHAVAGHAEIGDQLVGLRHDVDTLAALDAARRHGLSKLTRRALGAAPN